MRSRGPCPEGGAERSPGPEGPAGCRQDWEPRGRTRAGARAQVQGEFSRVECAGLAHGPCKAPGGRAGARSTALGAPRTQSATLSEGET